MILPINGAIRSIALSRKITKNSLLSSGDYDLAPSPHFICCSREALEKLNRKVDHKIQEILGILARYHPEEEVAILVIGEGQVKLVYFKPDLSPPECFKNLALDLQTLIQQLETEMSSGIDPLPG
jgi:hypothetical protein